MMKKRILALLLVLAAAACSGCGLLRLPLPTNAPEPTAIVTPASASRQAETPGPSGSPSSTALSKQQLIDAFRIVAGGSEYGSTEQKIRKWNAPVRISVHGNPTDEDRAALGRVMDWLNAIEGYPGISLVTSNANAGIWFVKLDEMKSVVDGYVEGNWGFFWTNYDSVTITKATVAIATDVTRQEERNHLIFEELVQSMGLMQDQYDYEDSIFYGRWTTVQQPSEMDRELVRMLYLPEVRHGMGVKESISIIENNLSLLE